MKTASSLADYRLLGGSGLRISPLCLGTMTFGQTWGADASESRRIFDAYVDRGGNFVDTANSYAQGKSEELLGDFIRQKRDRIVMATKYSLSDMADDPNAGGNHRKNMMRSIEASLKRLKTEYIDLYYLHIWDRTTPVDEVLRGLDDLVRQGKINYIGISDTPAWQVSRMQMMAELRGWSRFAALQVEYSLVQRTVERDLIPMAKELDIGVLAWSPLFNGVLTGKYSRKDLAPADGSSIEGRGQLLTAHGVLTERALDIADAVKKVAEQCGAEPAQVAIAWLLTNPAVSAPIIGLRTMQQFESNIGALDVKLDDAQLAALNEASAISLGFPHEFIDGPLARHFLFGETSIRMRGA